MKKFKYKTIIVDVTNVGDILDTLGDLGWEAYHVSNDRPNPIGTRMIIYYVTIFFKKEVDELLEVGPSPATCGAAQDDIQ